MNDLEMKRQELTRRFCTRYKIREAMKGIDGAVDAQYDESDADSTQRESCRELVNPYDLSVSAGEIRLLAKAGRLTYAVVAQDMGEGQFLIIPFSSYSDPACEGEFLIKNPGGSGIRVLQPWNARVWCRSSIAEGWRVGVLPDEDVEDAMSAWRSAIGLTVLSDDIASRTGVKVAECEQTVRQYLQEERENLSAIDSEDVRRIPWFIAIQRTQAEPIFEAVEYAQAAGPEKGCDIKRVECSVAGHDGCVLVVYNRELGEVSLDVYDQAGNPSVDLDGWILVDAEGNLLEKIKGSAISKLRVCDFGGACFLVDKESGVHALTVIKD